MKTFSEVYAALRRKNRKQYALLCGCCFFSVLLITAYGCMMRAPTILDALPEGGDSRKQMMMIFVLAVIGCGVFTVYASGLFFRQKSRETGVLLALGASRAQLRRALGRELALLSFGSCFLGAALGAPLAHGLWRLFRLLVVDSEEMPLTLDPKAYGIGLGFSAFVVAALFMMGARFIRRTNIIDIVQQSHRAEPIRAVPRWYGMAGILLMIAGALLGYGVPGWIIRTLHWYPPEWLTAPLYLPVFIGLYMVLLHTVVNGWRKKKNHYKNIVSTAMMQFQGRQTVRSLLVMTMLLAGGYFAAFYMPMMGVGSYMGFDARPVDFQYFYRADQDLPQRDEVEALADEYGVQLTDWRVQPAAVLGVDGWRYQETAAALGTTYEEEYAELVGSCTFLSESAYTALTGRAVVVRPGTIIGIMDDSGGSDGMFSGSATHLTNPVTGRTMDVTPIEQKLRDTMLFGRFVMDDNDYAHMTEGLTDVWREQYVCFNTADGTDSYPFAKALFDEIVDRSGAEVALPDAYDPVEALLCAQAGEPYEYAPENSEQFGIDRIDYDQRNASSFRLFWRYMPQFRALDRTEFVKTMAVYLMLFVFIAIVCFAAVALIAFTRCITLALVNAHVYDELRRLGASGRYLRQTARSQLRRVFLVPAVVGTSVIYAFYLMILYFNSEPAGITVGEAGGLAVCALLIAVLSAMLFGLYRAVRRRVYAMLDIG